MTQVVQEILRRIEQLPEADRLLLEQQLAEAKRKRKALDAHRQVQSQAELLSDLRRRSYAPPAGTPARSSCCVRTGNDDYLPVACVVDASVGIKGCRVSGTDFKE